MQLVYEELRRVISEIELPEFNRFQNLRKRVIEIMNGLLHKSLAPCNQMVRNLITIEDAYINTYHPDFMGGANAIFNVFDPMAYQAQQAKLEKLETKRRKDEIIFEEVFDNSLDLQETKSTGKPKQGLF